MTFVRTTFEETVPLPALELPPETVDELAAGTDIQAYLALQRYGAHSPEYAAWNTLARALWRLCARLAKEGVK